MCDCLSIRAVIAEATEISGKIQCVQIGSISILESKAYEDNLEVFISDLQIKCTGIMTMGLERVLKMYGVNNIDHKHSRNLRIDHKHKTLSTKKNVEYSVQG